MCRSGGKSPLAVGENNSTRLLNSKIKTIAGEKQLNSSGGKQLNSAAGMKQLNPSTAYNRLYSRMGFSYLPTWLTPGPGGIFWRLLFEGSSATLGEAVSRNSGACPFYSAPHHPKILELDYLPCPV
ncbi:hypothetical protein TNCV_1985771 [Trichonephila clavipes]|nr:hypothetical protein TNCV_1985771 [Trichonephila clavipes]